MSQMRIYSNWVERLEPEEMKVEALGYSWITVHEITSEKSWRHVPVRELAGPGWVTVYMFGPGPKKFDRVNDGSSIVSLR